MERIASYRNVEINTKPNEKPAKLVNMPSDTMCISDNVHLQTKIICVSIILLFNFYVYGVAN